MDYSRHFIVKFTFMNHWRDAIVTNIRKPTARSPRMGIDCDSPQCHTILLLQYQKPLNVSSKQPKHTEMSPAIFNRVSGLILDRCNVQLLRLRDSTVILWSEVSAPHKQNPFTERCPMPVRLILYYHGLRCFPDLQLSVVLSIPSPHLLWGSPSLLPNGHRGLFPNVKPAEA
jgi:hypothetical protein